MKKSIVFAGTVKHDDTKERTDHFSLRNAQGEDDNEGVKLLRLLLFPNGVKLNRNAASASQTDSPITLKVFARKLTDMASAVQIASITLAANAPKRAKEIALNIDFPTDTIVIAGCYSAVSFKIEADAEGKEVQFEHVRGDDVPTLTLVEAAESKEEEKKEGEKEEEKEEHEGEDVEEATAQAETESTVSTAMESGEIREEDSKAEPKKEEEDVEMKEEEEKDGEEKEGEKEGEEIEVKEEEEEAEHEEEEEAEYEDLVLEDHEEGHEDRPDEQSVEPEVKMTEEERKAHDAARAEEKRLRREREDREAEGLEEESEFTVDKWEPKKITCRRPPWRERAQQVDSKAWELFCDAVTTFETATLDDYLEDWLVTVENLLPSLRHCFREAKTTPIPEAPENTRENLPYLMMEWARFGLNLNRADGHSCPPKFLRAGLGIVEQIAHYSYEPRYGCVLLEEGIAWDLMNIITETTYSALQEDVLQVLHALQSCRGVSITAASSFLRFDKVREEEEEDEGEKGKEEEKEPKDEEFTSVYDRLALLAAQIDERSCESTALLDLSVRVLSRTNLNAAARGLLAATRKAVAAAAAAAGEEEKELSSAVTTFIDRFDENERLLRGAGQEEEAKRAVGVVGECDWAGVMSVLLSLPHDETTTKAVRFTARLMEGEECVGLFAISESSVALQKLLMKQLRMMEGGEGEGKEGKEETSLESDFVFDEAPSLEKRKRSGKELASTLVHRLRVLQLLDELAECNKELSFSTADSEPRLAVLHRMLRMAVTEEGEAALVFVFSECGFSLLSRLVTLVLEEPAWDPASKDRKRKLSIEARAKASFVYAHELMKVVCARAESATFWTRNARHYLKMVKYQQLLPPTSPLLEWWEPLKSGCIASGERGSHAVVTAMRTKLRDYLTQQTVAGGGDPPRGVVTILRILEEMLREGKRAATPRAAAARAETIAYCLKDGLHKVVEDLMKHWVEYRLTLWQLATPVEAGSTGAELFVEGAERALAILSVLYGTAMGASGSVKGVSVNGVGHAVGLWTMTTGVMKATSSVGEAGKRLRRAVLSFMRVMTGLEYREKEGKEMEGKEMEGDWEGKTALTRAMRRAMDYGRDRMQCQPAALCLLLQLQRWSAASDESRRAFEEGVKESSKAIAMLLLNYAAYAREMAAKTFERLDKTLGGETYAVLARSLITLINAAFSTRPRAQKKTRGLIDKEDVAIGVAKERQLAMVKLLARFTESRRFVRALLHALHDDAQGASRTNHMLRVLKSASTRSTVHWQFQELLITVLARLTDPSLYEGDTLGDVEMVEEEERAEGGEKEGEEEEEEEIAEMDADEFLDESVGLLGEEEEEEEKKEEEGEEEGEGKKESKGQQQPAADLLFRIARALIKVVGSPFSNPPVAVAAAAVGLLQKMYAEGSALAKDTIIRAWAEPQLGRYAPLRGLLHSAAGTVAAAAKAPGEKDQGKKKEAVETLLKSLAAHLSEVFSEEGGEGGRLAAVLDLAGKEDIPTGASDHPLMIQPTATVVEALPEGEAKRGWMGLVEKAKEMENADLPALPPRVHVIYKREENEAEGALEEMGKEIDLVIRLPYASGYSDVDMNMCLKTDIERTRKRAAVGVKGAEARLKWAERAEGMPLKRPDYQALYGHKGKEGEKKEGKSTPAPSSADKKAPGSASATRAAAARVAAIKKKPAAAAADKEAKKEESVPNRIQPAVVPSRPAKRSAPTTVPRAGIKKRR